MCTTVKIDIFYASLTSLCQDIGLNQIIYLECKACFLGVYSLYKVLSFLRTPEYKYIVCADMFSGASLTYSIGYIIFMEVF